MKAKLELFLLGDTFLGVAGGKSWAESVRTEGRGKGRQDGSQEAWTVSIGSTGTPLNVA